MSNITTTNRQAMLDLIAASDESAEISELTELENFLSVNTPAGVATFSASASIYISADTSIEIEYYGSPTITSNIVVDNQGILSQFDDGQGITSTQIISPSGLELIQSDGVNQTQIQFATGSVAINAFGAEDSTGISMNQTIIRLSGLQSYATDAAAGDAGVPSGGLYKHTQGSHTFLMIKD